MRTLEQFQEKCAAVFRPELRETKRSSASDISRKAEPLLSQKPAGQLTCLFPPDMSSWFA
ncbi:hypothetical protein RTCIAT899_CH15010 [Rhizobium tropici CIAT 899]|nr:hypothetical protein RTCIAT899_CH15010 [Rhizobium tropici CIAT 899]